MQLIKLCQDSNNNLNFVRLFASLMVVFSHSFPLAMGLGNSDFFKQVAGFTLGSIAVDIFFVVSGFLICKSLSAGRGVTEFFWARVLRVYPAVIVLTLLTVFFLGPALTSGEKGSYFNSVQTCAYFIKNVTLIFGVGDVLPNVFAHNPFPNAVNGSLWSLPYELKMYFLLFCVWMISAGLLKSQRVFSLCIVLIVLSALVVRFMAWDGSLALVSRLVFMFFTGALYYVARSKITLNFSLFIGVVIIDVIALFFSEWAFRVLYYATLGYMVMFVSFSWVFNFRFLNGKGDYSYGIYIYSFPIQQIIALLVPGVGVLGMFTMAVPLIFVAAFLSWWLVEKPMLNIKSGVVRVTQGVLRRLSPKVGG